MGSGEEILNSYLYPMTFPQLQPHTYRIIALIFLVLIIIGALAVVHSALARATIEVTAKADRATAVSTLTVQLADTAVEQISQPQSLTAKLLSASVSKNEPFTPQSDGKKIPDKARGTVVLVNTSSTPQPLLATTQLQLQGGDMIYRTDKYAVVPAQGEIEVGIIADKEGKEGEVPAPAKLVVVKLNNARQKEIYADVRKPIIGGEKIIAVLSQADFDTAQEKITILLKEDAKKKLSQTIGADLTDDHIIYGAVKVTSEQKIGDETDTFTLAGVLDAETPSLSQDAILSAAKQQYTSTLPAGYSLLGFNDHSVKWKLESLNEQKTEATLRTEIEAFTTITPNAEIINPQELVGLDVEKIKEKLLSNPNVSSIRVTFWPFWRTTAPSFANRITITIQSETTEETTNTK